MSGLRILVPVKRVLDYALKPRIAKTGTAVDLAGLKQSLNPFDELALEEAIRLRERHAKSKSPVAVDEIVAFSAGPAKAADVLRTSLAMGADRGLHVLVPEDVADDLEPLAVAKLLQKVVQDEGSNLVILGKQSISDDSGQTGQMLAGLLGWPQATQIASLRFTSDTEADITREVDGGVETLRTKLPFVVTTDLRLNEPRYASLPNIMKAKKKPLVKKTLEEMGIDIKSRLTTVKVQEPPPRKGGVKVENVDGMIGKLKELGAL